MELHTFWIGLRFIYCYFGELWWVDLKGIHIVQIFERYAPYLGDQSLRLCIDDNSEELS